jgi:hypothetical protein
VTTRTDVKVDFETSPRIAEVASPSTELTVQDLVDTLRKQEDRFLGMAFTKLLDASGKQPLGGGVSVGITVALQDVKIAFEGRTTPAETGTVTTGSGAPVVGTIAFEDTAAFFIANGVERGSLVINFTDQSVADVVSVDSETQLTTKLLVNGIGNTYDVADVYHVFNVIQVEVAGGNMTAVDDLAAELDPILPTAFTQVLRTLSSSATITDLAIINANTELARKLQTNRLETDPVAGLLTLYDDDDVTVLLTAPLFEDVGGIQSYRGQGAERRNRLT